jgi:regulator of protease activity HflC (stomatin/prohibitin superfamily)
MWYVITVVASLIVVTTLIGGFVVGSGEKVVRDEYGAEHALAGLRAKAFGIAGATAILWVLLSMLFVLHTVDAGHVGLVRAFGAYTGVKEAGLVTTFPWETVEEARIRNASHELLMDGGANGTAASKESQEVFVVATINYSLEKSCVQELYTNYGASYYETIIEPRAKQLFKAETVKFEAVGILPNREKIRRETQAELSKQLEVFCVRGLDFLLTNVGFGPAFTAAIEEKQVATQQAAAEQNRVQIAKQQAQQKIEEARGSATSTRIQARADAYAYRIRRRNLTPQLIEWERIQKWQPEIIYLPSDSVIYSAPRGSTPQTVVPTTTP